MRVISGTFRSRLLTAPRGMETRPTSDRLRETLFNVLSARVPDAVFVDLYAGSGAVGIEAISRGAREVFFAEDAPAALAAIRANLKALGVAAGYQLESGGTAALLKRLIARELRCDVVFLDPPYEEQDAYTRTLGSLGAEASAVLGADSIVVAEHSRKLLLQESYGTLRKTRTLTQGDAALSFFALSAERVNRQLP